MSSKPAAERHGMRSEHPCVTKADENPGSCATGRAGSGRRAGAGEASPGVRGPYRAAKLAAAVVLATSLGGCESIGGAAPPPERSPSEELLSLGDRMRDAGDLDVAIAIYRQAVERDAQEILPLLRLGSALAASGQTAQAAGAYDAALALDPMSAEALRGRGRASIVLGEPERAIEPLSRAIEQDDENPQNQRLLGTAYDLLGFHEKAQDAYLVGLELKPRDVDLQSNLALSFSLVGNHASAIDLMRSVANAPAAAEKHRRNYALVLGLAGRELEAEQVAQEILGESATRALLRKIRRLLLIEDSTVRARAIGTNEFSG